MNNATINIHRSPEEAPQWNEERRVEGGLTVAEFHIVRNGTEGGRSTVDIVLTDKDGIKYVGMITGRLFCAVAKAIGDER